MTSLKLFKLIFLCVVALAFSTISSHAISRVVSLSSYSSYFHFCYMIFFNLRQRKQTAVTHFNIDSEIIALEEAVCNDGLPILTFW